MALLETSQSNKTEQSGLRWDREKSEYGRQRGKLVMKKWVVHSREEKRNAITLLTCTVDEGEMREDITALDHSDWQGKWIKKTIKLETTNKGKHNSFEFSHFDEFGLFELWCSERKSRADDRQAMCEIWQFLERERGGSYTVWMSLFTM